MIINKIKLENIRSYLYQEINFPEGSLLLAGNIGSGKSSILLAIDFVLFGLRKGSLSGNSLLRHGKNVGSVELSFSIDGKDVIIKRVLKRSKDKVVQDSGYIIINNIKRELSPIELKQIVLDLLSYPKELLTKSKGMIYRYTVYTPQEEMQQILLGDRDLRLDTLRKVFGIDKYKRIRENSDKFISKLKEKIKLFSGVILDLGEKRLDLENKKRNLEKIELSINELLPILKEAKGNVLKKKDEIIVVEDKIRRLNELKKELEVVKTNLDNKEELKDSNEKELNKLIIEVSRLKIDLQGRELVNYDKEIENSEKELELKNEELNEYRVKDNEFKVKIEDKEDLKEKILGREKCPTCGQHISLEVRQDLAKVEGNKIKEFNEKKKIYSKRVKELEVETKEIDNNLKKLRLISKEFSGLKIKFENLKEKENRLENSMALKEKLKKEIKSLELKNIFLLQEFKKLKTVEKDYLDRKNELDKLLERERELDLKKVSFDKELETLKEIVKNLEEEVNKKLKIKENLDYLNRINEWFGKFFVNLMSVMEKRIMGRVYHDFNSLFEKWFNILVEDENLNIRLDEEFSPLIEQNGYETEYGFLSGGEKTAAALAYRLSLNQVINKLMTQIKTSDLLILDEPTDGFSEQQLDKIRDVLSELKLRQIIIVSHESKIESFVDNVIRFKKEGHVSSVV